MEAVSAEAEEALDKRLVRLITIKNASFDSLRFPFETKNCAPKAGLLLGRLHTIMQYLCAFFIR